MNASIIQCRLLAAFIAVATLIAASSDASAQLVNPGFDNAVPGLGPVGGFGTVVGPPFSPGAWVAELSSIVAIGGGPGGPVAPNSNPYMLQMSNSGDTLCQCWQVINVAGSLPPNPAVTFTALFNASSTAPSAVGAVRIFTFATGSNWPTWSQINQQTGTLDANTQTWQPITLPLTPIPTNTDWILAEVYYVNSTLGFSGNRAYVDDARLTIASIPEPTTVALAGMGLTGLALATFRRMRRERRVME